MTSFPTTVAALFPGAGLSAADGELRVPSPLDPAPSLGSRLGVDLRVKREDRLDDLGCGHKVRKLAHVIAHARAGGATTLVTAASVPSSQAVMVAASAARAGLGAHVVYCGDVQERPRSAAGNYLLVGLLGADVTWHEHTAWDRWPELLADVVARLRDQGEVPYAVPPGVTDWPGLLGSVELGLELAAQLPVDGVETHFVTAAGSGGTAFGIAIVAALLDLPWRVHGICLGTGPEGVLAEMDRQHADGEKALGTALPGPDRVRLHDGARGGGYDRWGRAEVTEIRRWLAHQRTLLDPTYTAKTAVGLAQLVADGIVPRGARVVFVHTGGSFRTLEGAPALDAELGALVRGPAAGPDSPAAVPEKNEESPS
ncbi:1-aminocyclopropane-1-carboxylate deaminase/D-cysteine desulfhydrase [Streptomyces sp. QL37]|uniref:1-aminocyclopropane-1-carboxylate deaminase/D-cysteine desulfhydrase n=1 Tax=Streptomyces sp. QL37 TaxID=2093747 RepID=UPI001374DA4C|nr:pyridoxal-phosphate dependent enzyme [Streptomyces sp. QL37]